MSEEELVYRRVFRAPRELVWRCLTDLGDRNSAVVIQQRNVPDATRRPDARAGFLTSLDKLEQRLADLNQHDRPKEDRP